MSKVSWNAFVKKSPNFKSDCNNCYALTLIEALETLARSYFNMDLQLSP